MRTASRSIVLLGSLTALALLGLAAGQSQAKTAPAKPGAAKKAMPYSTIAPLIDSKCKSCHNAKKHPEAIDLSSYGALMKSGEHGPIVIAGHPEKSKLIMYVDGTKQPRMPYKTAPLKDKEITLLKQWISAGAKK